MAVGALAGMLLLLLLSRHYVNWRLANDTCASFVFSSASGKKVKAVEAW